MSKKNPPIRAKKTANSFLRKKEEMKIKIKTKFKGREKNLGKLVSSKIKNKMEKIKMISFFI
jgi:translation initiation factor IF-3